MERLIRWGILGSGKIARKFSADLAYTEGAKLIAVGSRHQSSADAFAREFSLPYAHGTYEALAANPEVDVIYIASPHSLHHEHTILCLQHKKAVLCEKAFAINTRQALEMIALSRQNQVFLMEALWTKFLPHYQKVMQMIQEDTLGTIASVLINFGFIPPENAFRSPVRSGIRWWNLAGHRYIQCIYGFIYTWPTRRSGSVHDPKCQRDRRTVCRAF